ncbi:FecR domain-containing protein [Thauera linaloolentis]|uniref:FecR protein n=1 Tax=Thauera linaloolentis (strain DSM 12138 / JCM 21573 / CCUG 41526 / CIP 105981 / IAM 15112 / NBRC 102519 / 47Lol) TaxID=1123367 RepID=N6Z9F0_THAL4|nr:FecR domain-containing protein [Thauera linaloolentis]ENO88779.1 FecR protein [Thauera linaloolentis 47Lol = DSM 12138]MCM8564912.1 FecR domain-containing protein [Thauera linaloolentis]
MAATDGAMPPAGGTGDEAVKPGRRSLEEAASWYAALCSEDVTGAERQAWRDWLARSPEHASAWEHVEAVSRRFAPLHGTDPDAAVAGVAAARRGPVSRRRMLSGMAGLFGLGLAGWLGWRHTALPEVLMAWSADYRTGIGEQREITLADGTQVWLNTDSALSVEYRAGVRLLRLAAGEILVHTASDPGGRPFYVATRYGRMQALGTRFAVNHDQHRTRLDVFESAVEIRNAAGALQRVEAGQRADFTADGVSPLQAAERAREAWHRGVVVADDIPLQQLIEELARYQPGHIGVAPEVAELSVMGVYPAGDIDHALAMLENTLPIRIERPLPWWISIEAK